MKTNNTRPLNDAWFEKVESFTKHWHRKDDNTLILWFSGVPGSDPNCWPATQAFSGPKTTAGFVISEKFDRICGKTALTVKEPLNVIEERRLEREKK